MLKLFKKNGKPTDPLFDRISVGVAVLFVGGRQMFGRMPTLTRVDAIHALSPLS